MLMHKQLQKSVFGPIFPHLDLPGNSSYLSKFVYSPWRLFVFILIISSLMISGLSAQHISKDYVATPILPVKIKESKQVGIVISNKGLSILTKADGTRESIRHKTAISVGDRIDTGLGAFIQVEFIDHSKFSLHGSSDLTVEAYEYTPKGNMEYVAQMKNGLMSFMAGEIGKHAPHKFHIKTSQGVVGIEGSSGEILTSDGTLPGRPSMMEIMKKGGIGITLEPAFRGEYEGPPVLVVSNSGTGFIIGPTGEMDTAFFSTSPGEKYAVQENTRIAEVQRNTLLVEKADSNEQDTEKTSLISKDQNTVSLMEEESIIEADRIEFDVKRFPFKSIKKFAKAFKKAPHITDNYLISQEIDNLKEKASTIIFNETAQSNEKKLGGLTRSSGDYSGFLTGLHSNNDFVNSFASRILPQVYSDTQKLLINILKSKTNLNFTLPTPTATTYQQVIADTVTEGARSFKRIYDNLNEFFIINHVINDPSEKIDELLFFGKASINSTIPFPENVTNAVSANIPSSGVRFYSSQNTPNGHADSLLIKGETNLNTPNSHSSVEDFPLLRESILVKNRNFLNAAFSNNATVDFTHNKISGSSYGNNLGTFAGNFLYKDDSTNQVNSSKAPLLFQASLPSVYYNGQLEVDGSITQLHLYNTLGFVATPPTLSATADPKSLIFDNKLLTSYSGNGQLFGSEAQGIGVQADDLGGGYFAGASFLNKTKVKLSSTEGKYIGHTQGLQVSPESLSLSHVQGEMELSPSFSLSSLTGFLNFTGNDNNTKTISASRHSTAIDNQNLFSELSGEESFVSNPDASFLSSFELPSILNPTSREFSKPTGVMWGMWNVVEEESAGGNIKNFYPGMHNFWSAGIAQKLSSSNPMLHYTGSSIRTAVYNSTSTKSEAASDFGISKYLVDRNNGKMLGLSFFSSGDIQVFRGTHDDNTYTGQLAGFSTNGNNAANGLFSASFDDLGTLNGIFASTSGESLSYEFSRSLNNTSAVNSQFGVGVATRVKETPVLTEAIYPGTIEGLIFSNSGSIKTIQGGSSGADLGIFGSTTLDNSQNELDFTAAITINDNFLQVSTQILGANLNSGINAFISKDAFITSTIGALGSPPSIAPVSFGPDFPLDLLDPTNSYIVAMPGLEDYKYVSWGKWGAKGIINENRAFGYLGFCEVIDFNVAANLTNAGNSGTSVYHFSGPSIASVFDAQNPNGVIRFGSSSLDVNFSNGILYGSVLYGDDLLVDLNGSFQSITRFEGSTTLNGVRNEKTFSIDFIGSLVDEGIGTFSASDNSTVITGALAGKNVGKFSSESLHGDLNGIVASSSGISLLDNSSSTFDIKASNNRIFGHVTFDNAAPAADYSLITLSKSFLHHDDLENQNTFIDKDHFFSKVEHTAALSPVSIGSAFPSSTIDSNISYIQSLPGLENFQYISWGQWQTTGVAHTAFGYFGSGRNDSSLIPDIGAIQASGSTVFTYHGPSIGAIFNDSSSLATAATGTSTLSVDFSGAGNVTGSISLGSHTIGLNSSSINSAAFSGNTTFSGNTVTNGYSGRFYGPAAEEAAGSFKAFDGGNIKITGAFGAAK
ncbi:MAG: hypothetical protein ACI9S8_001206 [Chlamydiales bacterium]|jgi:hypothetical protein